MYLHLFQIPYFHIVQVWLDNRGSILLRSNHKAMTQELDMHTKLFLAYNSEKY